jgi:hypothetical protein
MLRDPAWSIGKAKRGQGNPMMSRLFGRKSDGSGAWPVSGSRLEEGGRGFAQLEDRHLDEGAVGEQGQEQEFGARTGCVYNGSESKQRCETVLSDCRAMRLRLRCGARWRLSGSTSSRFRGQAATM